MSLSEKYLSIALATFVCLANPFPGRSAQANELLPYDAPRTQRVGVFEFTGKPVCRYLGNDRHEISFSVKAFCDVTVAILDEKGNVVRHLGSGVLGNNAPEPFKKGALKQTVLWNGKSDLGHYPRNISKLRVRVSLGLKPVFDKWLGAKDPHNLPGRNLGVAVDAAGAYVLTLGKRRKLYVRTFDLDGNYVQSLVPPQAGVPQSKLSGLGYVEYEPGKRAVHAGSVFETTADHARYPVGSLGKKLADMQPALIGNKLYFCTGGSRSPSKLFYIKTDGSTDQAGITGRPITPGLPHTQSRFCASPDGKWIYMTGDGIPAIWRLAADGQKQAEHFFGDRKKSGSDNEHLNKALGVACDAKGRVYVCDNFNNRIQILSPDGKYLKTIKIERPLCICVHQKTGAIYVQQAKRIKGQSVHRITKLTSFDNPKESAHVEGPFGVMALDSWSAKPRLWIIGGFAFRRSSGISTSGKFELTVWEESGETFKEILNFDTLAKKAEGRAYVGKPSGSALGRKVVCNPKLEQVISGGVYDLKSGKNLGGYGFRHVHGKSMSRVKYDDIAIDSKGFMHVHFNPGFYTSGVGRVDTTNPNVQGIHNRGDITTYPEVPYDYGVERKGWIGMMPTRCQPGSKFFQDGIGVNMRGDVAVESNIYYVPKMDALGTAMMENGRLPEPGSGRIGKSSYAGFMKKVREMQKKGEKVYSIKRKPGVSLSTSTLWVFDWTGEVSRECAVNSGGLINGGQMDEDGALYYVVVHPRLRGGQTFLAGQGGTFGAPDNKQNRNPFTGTLVKTRNDRLNTMYLESAPVKLDPLPNRPADLLPGAGKPNKTKRNRIWVDGAEWLYAGASPITPKTCSCPTQRMHLDYFKRAFVPEQYRHSIGILDTAGNLIMHLGRYGNYDDARAMKPGSEDIPMTVVRFISGTDRFLCFEDNGERLIVLKLQYHDEETIPLAQK